MQDAVSAQMILMKNYLTACGRVCAKYQNFYGNCKRTAHVTGSYVLELQPVSSSMSDLRLDAEKTQDGCGKLRLDFKKDSSSLSDFCVMFMTDLEKKERGADGPYIIFYLQCPS
jgi:hypothetical protein